MKRCPVGRVLSLAWTAAALGVLIAPPASQAGSFTNCGEMTVGPNATKILKAKKMKCGNARDVASEVEDDLRQGDLLIGDTTSVRRFGCQILGFFEPYEPAYECVHTRQEGKKLKALYPPEREGKTSRLSPPKRQLPKLYSGAATDFTGRSLVQEFPFTTDPTSRDIGCKRRLSRVKFRCRVSFYAGDSSWHGAVQIRYIRKVGGRLGFRYVMRLVHTNEYCVFVLDKPRRECQDRLTEKGNDYV